MNATAATGRARGHIRRSALRHGLVVGLAAAAFACVFALRLVQPETQDAITLFYCVPIALVAAELGLAAGVGAALTALGLVAVWVQVSGTAVTPIGYLSRGTAFLLVGAVVGRAVDEARRSRHFSQQFFELARDLFCVADRRGRFLRVNPAWGRLLGYRAEELVSRAFIDFVHPEDRAATELEAARVAAGHPTVSFTNRYRARDGSWHWIEWASRMDPADGVIYAAARDVTERTRLEKQLRALAHEDPLTGLLNRRRFQEEVELALEHARRYGTRPALLLVDVDRFKEVNDVYGHPVGDAVLRGVAALLTRCTRASDRVARLGGDEFAVLLPDAGREDAERVAAKLCEESATGEAAAVEELEATPTLSIGVAVAEEPLGVSQAKLVDAADAALYRAKRSGRNRWATGAVRAAGAAAI